MMIFIIQKVMGQAPHSTGGFLRFTQVKMKKF